MSENVRELQEDIVLENCFISVFPKFISKQDKSFYKFMSDYTRTNYSATADAVKEAVVVNLLKEIVVIANQIWKVNPARFDERLIKDKNLYNVIKNKISKDGKPLPFNTRELYKRIREAISHNSETKSNIIYNLHNFEVNLGKVNGADYIVELEIYELYQLFHVLFANRQEGARYFVTYSENEIHTREDVRNSIHLIDAQTRRSVPLDNNQVERIYNYFTYGSKDKTTQGNRNIIEHLVAVPNNPETLLSEKMLAFKMIAAVTSKSTYKEVVESNQFLNTEALVVDVYFSTVTNLLFRIVSSRTNDEIETMLQGTGLNLTKENIRNLRNSLCHGRYFHDYRNGFYFYDGSKNIDFKLKLSVEDINKMLDVLAKGLYEVKTFGKKY